jgi:excisionase family DNA binding protein
MKTAVRTHAKAHHKEIQRKESAIYQSVEELAREIGISRQSAYAALRNNTIPHIRLGKRYILPKAAIAEWLRNPTAFDDALASNRPGVRNSVGVVRQ